MGDATENLPGAAARLVCGNVSVAPDGDLSVRHLLAAISDAIVDELQSQPEVLNANTEFGEPVLPSV